jgi:hypothetical protein
VKATALAAALLSALHCAVALGQELSPRAYWPAPEGTQIASIGYTYNTGDTLTDPSLPITGANSDLHTVFVTYLRTINLAGRTANIILEQPYTWGTARGELDSGSRARRHLDGHGDLAFTTSINLLGAPSMTREEFQALRADPPQILGASLRVVAPTGDYDKDKVVNTGARRWAAKAELGYVLPLQPRWLLEVETGAWWFQDNDDFVGGTKEQESIYAAEFHLVHRFSPGFWGSVDANYYKGGRTRVDGEKLDDLQRTSKFGTTLVFPIGKGKALKLNYSTGSASGKGNDFDSVLVSFNTAL